MIADSILDLKVMVAADYSQIEVRELAEISGDPRLIGHFKSGKDVHCLVGHDLTGLPPERIKAEKGLRKGIKNMHFGIIYGKAKAGIYDYVVMKIRDVEGPNADLTGITRRGLEKQYDKYFQTYKHVARYIERMRRQVKEKGYVETMFGFRSDIYIDGGDDSGRSSYWANQAINRPIQGSAHTFSLMAMALLSLKPRTYQLLSEPIMEVHDALYWLVKLRHLPEAYKLIKYLLEEAVVDYTKQYFRRTLQVPLLAEASAGFCLGSMIDYEGESIEEFLPKWREKQLEIESKTWREQKL